MRFSFQFPDFGFGIWYVARDGLLFNRGTLSCMVAWWVLEWELPEKAKV